MATTPQSSSSNKSSTPSSNQAMGSQSSPAPQGQMQSQQSQGGQLDQFVTYMKGNWKTILSELVAAGVSAYLAHGAKEKSSKM